MSVETMSASKCIPVDLSWRIHHLTIQWGDKALPVARQIENDLTEPQIRWNYTWILMYVWQEEKGDF